MIDISVKAALRIICGHCGHTQYATVEELLQGDFKNESPTRTVTLECAGCSGINNVYIDQETMARARKAHNKDSVCSGVKLVVNND